MIIIFLVIIATVLANNYDFVTCYNDNLKVNMTYPEGTECDDIVIIDDDEKIEGSKDELEHQEEAEDWDKNGWTKLK